MHLSVMSTKTITIKTEAYERLKVRKKPRESFTDVINRLTGRRSLLGFAGFLSGKRADEIEDSIKKLRAGSANRMARIASELE